MRGARQKIEQYTAPGLHRGYLNSLYITVTAVDLLKAKSQPRFEPKILQFPNLEAQILPKLRIFRVKLFPCDQNFSSTMQIQLHTVP